jgi:hypothetical protein
MSASKIGVVKPHRFDADPDPTLKLCQASKIRRIFVEKPDPKGLSTFSKRTESRRTGDSNSGPPNLELDALNKWLAMPMLVLIVSAGFSTI